MTSIEEMAKKFTSGGYLLFLFLVILSLIIFVIIVGYPWLIPIISAIGASLTLYLSKPQDKKLAYFTFALILIPAVWLAWDFYQTQQTKQEIQRLAINKVSLETYLYLQMLRDMIFFSSDGWLPKNEEEFFSGKTATLICCNLNIDTQASVVPKRPWRRYFAERSLNCRKALNDVLQNYGENLDADFVNKISAVEGSVLLGLAEFAVLIPVVDKQIGFDDRPPLLCCGVESGIEKNLSQIFSLYQEIRKQEKRFDIKKDWAFLNVESNPFQLPNQLGKDRFIPTTQPNK